MTSQKHNLMNRRKSRQLSKNNISHQQVQALLSCRHQFHQHRPLHNQKQNLKNQKRRRRKKRSLLLNNQQHQVACPHSHSWALCQHLKIMKQIIMNRNKKKQQKNNNNKMISQLSLFLVLVSWIIEQNIYMTHEIIDMLCWDHWVLIPIWALIIILVQ